MQKSDMFWIGAFALGFLFSFAVGFVPPGIGLFLFFNTALYGIWKLSKNNPHKNALEKTAISSWLVNVFMGLFVVFTLPYLYRYDLSIITLLVFFHIIFLFVFVFISVLPGVLHIVDFFSLFIAPLSVGLTWVIESLKSVGDLFKGNSNVVKFMLKLILYTAISLAVFIIFANLLSQSDAEFQKRIQSILESLKLSEIMGRTVLGVIMSFMAAGILTIIGYFNLVPLLGSSAERVKQQWDKAFTAVTYKRTDSLLPLVITVPVALLFALYVWVQVKYLFGVDIQQILTKYSFAEYARRGFIELLIVGVLTYPVLAWTMNRAKSTWILPRIANFAINSSIVALLVVMLYSLVFRMNLYMTTYGPSVLRMYVIIGAVVVALSLLAYELVALLKVKQTGYSFMHALLFGDYSVIAFFAGILLLGSVAFVPWNTVVASQIAQEYSKSKKVDVFQLTQLSDEAQPTVFNLAKKLSEDGLKDGSNVLAVHVLQVRDSYKETRQVSLFTNLFGFNLAGNAIEDMSSAKAADIDTAANENIKTHAKSIVQSYLQAIANNNFTLARTFYDPAMKSNNIAGFSDSVSLGSISVQDCGCSVIDGFNRTVTVSATGVLSRTRDFEPGYDAVPAGGVKPSVVIRKETLSIQTTLGIRNGKLVIVDSNIVLAYLPDAIGQQQNSTTSLQDYGYSQYCETPNLTVLFSPSRQCAGENVYQDVRLQQIPFQESDFKTVSK